MSRSIFSFGLILLAACAHAPTGELAAEEDQALAEAYARAYSSSQLADYQQAIAAHASWLEAHPGDRAARARYARLLWATGELRRAADELARVAEGSSDHLARTSARNAVVALQALVRGEKAALRPLRELGHVEASILDFKSPPIVLPESPQKERAIPEAESALAAACDAYVEIAAPEDDALQTIAAISLEIHFRYGQARDGADRCAKIVARWPHVELAVSCVRATLDSLNQRKQWPELERHARAFRGNLSLIGADHELQRWLEEAVQISTFNRIQESAEAGSNAKKVDRTKLIEGAKAFRDFQREFPYSSHSDKALYNAVAYFALAGMKEDAIGAANTLFAVYADSPLVPEVRRILAQLGEVATLTRSQK